MTDDLGLNRREVLNSLSDKNRNDTKPKFLTKTINGEEATRYNIGINTGDHDTADVVRSHAQSVGHEIYLTDVRDVITGYFTSEDIKKVRALTNVAYVEEDYLLEPHTEAKRQPDAGTVEQDSDNGDKTDGETTQKDASKYPWGLGRIGALTAHENGNTGSGTDIVIIDTGSHAVHEALDGNLGDGVFFQYEDQYGEQRDTKCTETDGKYQGDVTCHQGWGDDQYHGTHVAGSAGAEDMSISSNDIAGQSNTPNSVERITGVAPDATIHAANVFEWFYDYFGNGEWSALAPSSNTAKAIKWAADQNYDVANASLGGPNAQSVIKDALDYATNQNNLIFVSSAGNDGEKTRCDDDDCVGYPAAFSDAIAVANAQNDDTISSSSSPGPEVEVAAPGTSTMSSWTPHVFPPEDYDTIDSEVFYYPISGTSMASPHVTGLAALIKAHSNVTDNSEVRNIIKNTTEDLGEAEVDQGNGLIDVQAAIEEANNSFQEPLTQSDLSTSLGGDPQFNKPAVDSQRVYVGGLQNNFYAFPRGDLSSGPTWSVSRGSKAGLSDSSGHLYTDSDPNKVIFGSGQGTLYAADAADTKNVAWSKSLGSAITSSPTSYNGTIFVGTNDGTVYAFDGSGTQQWSTSVSGGVYSDLVAAETSGTGYLYVTTEGGTLEVLKTSDGSVQWTESSFSEFGSSSPAVGGGRVYVAADEVHAYDAGGSKNQQWSSSTFGGTAGSNPLYHSGSVYVGSADGKLYSYDASSGSENWSKSTGDTVAGSPAVNDSGDRIAVISMNGTLYLYDTSGTEVGKDANISGSSGTRATPTMDSAELFLPIQQGSLVKFT